LSQVVVLVAQTERVVVVLVGIVRLLLVNLLVVVLAQSL